MPHRDPAKERYWRRLLRLWRSSVLTVRDFCAEHGISEPSFYCWRREIERRNRQRQRVAPKIPASAPQPAFLELAIDNKAASAIEVVLSERRLLRIRPGFDADLLRQLVRVLEEPSC
jgi:hypothetical protein